MASVATDGAPVTEMTLVEQMRAMVEREPTLDDAVGLTDRLGRLCRASVRDLPAAGAGGASWVPMGLGASQPYPTRTTPGSRSFSSRWARGRAWTPTPQVVLVPGLDAGAMRRWRSYAPAAFEKGVRAVFAFPMQIGTARLGVFDVYREQAGSLSKPAFSHAVAFADMALTTLLDGQHALRRARRPRG